MRILCEVELGFVSGGDGDGDSGGSTGGSGGGSGSDGGGQIFGDGMEGDAELGDGEGRVPYVQYEQDL